MKRYKWCLEKLTLIQLITAQKGYGYVSIENLKRIIRKQNRLDGITPEEHYKIHFS